MTPNTDRDERVRQLISELSNVEFEARGLARSRYHDRLFVAGRPRPTNEQFDEGWSAARNFYLEYAATRMRDLCVQKLKSVAQTHREMAEKFKGKEMGELQAIRAEECDTLVGILQFLTLEETET